MAPVLAPAGFGMFRSTPLPAGMQVCKVQNMPVLGWMGVCKNQNMPITVRAGAERI
jgi:hypothetical protein